MGYVRRVARATRMPTVDELERVLRETGRYAKHFRDHMLIALKIELTENGPAHSRSLHRVALAGVGCRTRARQTALRAPQMPASGRYAVS